MKMALDTKTIKEELPDMEAALYEINSSRRIKDTKDRCRSPESPEGARAVAPHSPISPQTQTSNPSGGGTGGGGSSESLSRNGSTSPNMASNGSPPPVVSASSLLSTLPGSVTPQQDSVRLLMKIRRFLGALVQFGQETNSEIGDRVRSLVLSLASGNITPEEFKSGLQEATNFPLRPYVLPFLKTHIPLLQRELTVLARASNQSISQFIRTNEGSVFEFAHSPTEHSEIFLNLDGGGGGGGLGSSFNGSGFLLKRRTSDNLFENGVGHGNASNHPDWSDHLIPAKRPHHSILLNNHLQSLGGYGNPSIHHGSFFDYHQINGSYATSQPNSDPLFYAEKASNSYREDREHRSVTTSSNSDIFSRHRNGGAPSMINGTSSSNPSSGGEEEWKNIHTMLNCISAMVDKTKRAITILQQRGMDSHQSIQETSLMEVKRLTDEKVAEFKRSAEDAVNQVKRQAVIEIQRAVAVAENRAVEIVAQERLKMEKLFAEMSKNSSTETTTTTTDGENQLNVCWKCGRKAAETCSGCSLAKYCSAYCQHKDWEQHIKICGTIRVSESGSKLPPAKRTVIAAPSRSSPPQSQAQAQVTVTATAQQQTQAITPSQQQPTSVTNGGTSTIK